MQARKWRIPGLKVPGAVPQSAGVGGYEFSGSGIPTGIIGTSY